MCLGVSLLRMDEVGEFCRVTNEEDGSVIEYPIPVTFLRPQLDRKPTRVASRVCRPTLTADSGESYRRTRTISDLVEELGTCEVGDVVSDFEVAVCAGAFGVDLVRRFRTVRSRDILCTS